MKVTIRIIINKPPIVRFGAWKSEMKDKTLLKELPHESLVILPFPLLN